LSRTDDDEVNACSARWPDFIICYVESRPSGVTDPSLFKHAVVSFNKLYGTMLRSVKATYIYHNNNLHFMSYVRHIMPSDYNDYVYVGGLISTTTTPTSGNRVYQAGALWF
jgi:hypothetical protein